MSRLVENAERALQRVPVTNEDGTVVEYHYEGSVANRALELLGKELGMFIDRKEIRTQVDARAADPGELQSRRTERRAFAD